ncbi:MAG: SUMF1/EgtB/PvdO family nonheme iron enzyme [bacterium]|nr:SUMF1/EgtB/PvdO family nonheme iron enzyme [bacterium]
MLAPFSKGQICRFVDRWYLTVAASYDLTPEQAQTKTTQLKEQIFNRQALYILAEKPLLLTLMVSLHAWRLGDLPKNRVELYQETTELLLDRWERRKFIQQDSESLPPSLLEWLKADKGTLLTLLSKLAFQAHGKQLDTSGTTADISETDLLHGLLEIGDETIKPKLLSRYLQERVGLLIPRGVGVYTFPNRIFQEYLAACYLTEQDDYPENVAELARSNPNRWREVLLLVGAKAARGIAASIWYLVEALCWKDIDSTEADAEDAWGALLAAQALSETTHLGQIHKRHHPKLERVRRWLVAILTEQAEIDPGKTFPLIERALAGNLLAQLGDSRAGIGLREDGLLDIIWCDVPAGDFLMGSDPAQDREADEDEQPQHIVQLSEFSISRFPVTNAQYLAFIEDGGYSQRSFWTAEGWTWKEKKSISGPQIFGEEFDLSNHPVVGVSWYEAMAFCQWLTQHLRKSGELSDTQEIHLPTEAEWEKAARSTDGRIFPWGSEITSELANNRNTELVVTSTVGCFSRGASPYGCEDIAGNAREWCLDWFDSRYYSTSPKENPTGPASGSDRVIRGGDWNFYSEQCRVAYRGKRWPDMRSNSSGFRLVRTSSSIKNSPLPYLEDVAGVLTQTQQKELLELLAPRNSTNLGRIFIQIIPKLPEDTTVEAYAHMRINDPPSQRSEPNDRILLVVAVNDRKVRIETSKNVWKFLTDNECTAIIKEHLVPHFRQENYFQGIYDGILAMITRLEDE